MGIYLLIVFIPSLIALIISKIINKDSLDFNEKLMQIGALVVTTAISMGVLYLSNATKITDHEILNGYVTSKKASKVGCEHQYQCGQTCSTDSKGNQTCIPIFCDEHDYDIDWDVHTTVGTFEIKRIDRQGVREPPRFTRVMAGDPAAKESSTKNYLLLDDSAFKTAEDIVEKYKDVKIKYPSTYDYYNINRVINDTSLNTQYINDFYNNLLKTKGKEKQLNVIVVVTNKSEDFYDYIIHEWNGGKKNDVILFYGVDKEGKLNWFKSTSFADGQDNRELHARLRIESQDKTLGVSLVSDHANMIVKYFNRLPNETFSHLDVLTAVPMWLIIFASILNLTATITLSYLFNRKYL